MTMPNFQPESEVGLSDRVVHANFERKFKGRPLDAGRQFSTASKRFVGPAPGTWSHIQAEENRLRAVPETMQVITRFTYGY